MKRTIAVTILSLALGGRALFGQNLDKRAFCSVSEAVLEGAFPDNAQLTPQGRATLESLSRMKILGIVQASPLAHTYPMGGSDPSLQIYHPARLRFNINQREKPFSVESYGASAASETGTVWICSLTLNTSPISIIWISKEVRQFERERSPWPIRIRDSRNQCHTHRRGCGIAQVDEAVGGGQEALSKIEGRPNMKVSVLRRAPLRPLETELRNCWESPAKEMVSHENLHVRKVAQ